MRGSILQVMLGHKQFDTTRRYYLDTTDEDLATEHEHFSPLDRMTRVLPATARAQPRSSQQPKPLPPAEELLREVQATSYRATARRHGVSDTLIRKRLKKAGLLQ
jgi:hypothetical protein